MESSNLIAALIIDIVLICVLVVISAGCSLAISLRFFLKRSGPLAEIAAGRSSVIIAYTMVAVAMAGGFVYWAIQLLVLLKQLFDFPLGSSTTISLAVIVATGAATWSIYFMLDRDHLHKTGGSPSPHRLIG